MTREEVNKLIMQACERTWNEKTCKEIFEALSQEPTVQDKQAESEKYQKAFDDGYENGYAQARFDYEQEPTDAISRDAVNNLQKYRYNCGDTSITCVSLKSINELPPVTQKCEKCAMNGSGSKYCDNCRQKSGKWKVTPMSKIAYCSICDELIKDIPASIVTQFEFCPKCGAKIESEDKE